MAGYEKRSLTAAQEKALDTAAASVESAYEAARSGLAAAGLDVETPGTGEGSFRCLRCNCDHFEPSPEFGLRCRRPTCRHGFIAHDVR